MKKKIIICGKLASKYEAFNNYKEDKKNGVLFWSTGVHHDHHLISPYIDTWFDIHKNPTNKDKNTVHRDDFPMDECISLLGGHYFNNTMSFLIAYAILEGATEIALYGSRFTIDHDLRAGQYNNVRELIFFAKGRGITVTAPADEVMLKEYLYSGKQDFDS